MTAAIYRCFAADDTLLYVGQSINSANRLSQHKARSVWWDQVVRIEIEAIAASDLNVAELRAIVNESPVHNVIRTGSSRGKHVRRPSNTYTGDSPHKRLAAAALGQPVTEWIAIRRADGRSWREIAADLADATDGQIVVTHEAVRGWHEATAA